MLFLLKGIVVGTNGLVNHILGERYIEKGEIKTCVGGLFSHIEKELLKIGGAIDVKNVDLKLPPHGWLAGLGIGLIFDKEKMKLLLEKMLMEVGVKILYMTDIVDLIKDKDKIKGIIVHNKSGLYIISGQYFVDATGDTDIAHWQGLNIKKVTLKAECRQHLWNCIWKMLIGKNLPNI